ncbi:MAG: ABC transporter ATP-binding protein [Deltaproteobacteria bacterium]|nr:ABC transporter ATP-binding protein [Deltaproteobacteria bacterium]MBW2413887.1 ABC transporter ATP-binding protein [Deltaproteobacteria bacterium]
MGDESTHVRPLTRSRELGPAILIDHLTVEFEQGESKIVALSDVDLKIAAGQLVTVMGPSGSGKSTLLTVIAGLRKPSSGRVLVGDDEITAMTEDQATRFRRRQIGIVLQFFNLVPTIDVQRNVGLPLRIDGVRPRQVQPRVDFLLDRLGVAHRRNHYPHQLSGGEMQRVAIARALVAAPQLLLADEPTGNLDSQRGDEILSLMRTLCADEGVTAILMTHDLRAVSYSDRAITLRDGKVAEDVAAMAPFAD